MGGPKIDCTPLGTALLPTLSSPRAMVSTVSRSTLHSASLSLPIPISRFHRAAKFTHSTRGIHCISTLPPLTTSTASSFRPPANPRIPHDMWEVWSLMYIGRCSMVVSLGIRMTRRVRTGSSGCFTKHSLWPF
jgi:hypothetical protein